MRGQAALSAGVKEITFLLKNFKTDFDRFHEKVFDFNLARDTSGIGSRDA